MRLEYLFPVVIIALMLLSGAVYGVKGDVARMIYWFSGALLNISIFYVK